MKILQILIIFLICLGVPAFAETYNIAVFEFDATGMDSSEARQVTNFMRQRLNTTEIQVVETQSVEYSITDVTMDNTKAVKLGYDLGADFVIVGSLGKIGDLFTIDAKLLNVGTAESFENDGSYEGSLELFLLNTVANLTDEMIELIIPEDQPPQPQPQIPAVKKRGRWYKKWWLWAGIGGAAIIGGVLAQGGSDNPESTETDEYLPEPPELP